MGLNENDDDDGPDDGIDDDQDDDEEVASVDEEEGAAANEPEDEQVDDEEVEPTDLDLIGSEEPSANGVCPTNGEDDAEGNDKSNDATDGEGDE